MSRRLPHGSRHTGAIAAAAVALGLLGLTAGIWAGASPNRASQPAAPPAADAVAEADTDPEAASGSAPQAAGSVAKGASSQGVSNQGASNKAASGEGTLNERASDEAASDTAGRSQPQFAPEDLYAPTGAETELEGLQAAEEGRIGTPAFVMFHADWCHVCQQVMPIVDQLRHEYDGQVAFLKMNVDHPDTREANARYRVRGTPTFVAIDSGGQVLQSFSGWPGDQQVVTVLNQMAEVQ